MLLNIDRISLNGGTQTRSQLNEEHVSNLVEQIDSGYVLPPIGLVFDGTTYWLWDGFHRVEAHKLADKKRIEAKVSQGTQRDAVLKSLGANASHGLPRNNGDRKRAVMRMLTDDEWSQWPDTKIAKTCACSVGYVKRLRLETLPTIPGISIEIDEPTIITDDAPTPAAQLAATPGAHVEIDGQAGTVMNITDGGAIFQVLVEGEVKPLLRGEFTVIAAAEPKPDDTDTPQRMSKHQQLLELKRFVGRIAKNNAVPDTVREEAVVLMALLS